MITFKILKNQFSIRNYFIIIFGSNLQILTAGAGVLDDGLYDDAEPSTLEDDLNQGQGDERTEIILAATFLLIVILSFIA